MAVIPCFIAVKLLPKPIVNEVKFKSILKTSVRRHLLNVIELHQLHNNVLINQKQLHLLALEVFKSVMNLNPDFMYSYFNTNAIPYDLRKGTKVFLPPVKSFLLELNCTFQRELSMV